MHVSLNSQIRFQEVCFLHLGRNLTVKSDSLIAHSHLKVPVSVWAIQWSVNFSGPWFVQTSDAYVTAKAANVDMLPIHYTDRTNESDFITCEATAQRILKIEFVIQNGSGAV